MKKTKIVQLTNKAFTFKQATKTMMMDPNNQQQQKQQKQQQQHDHEHENGYDTCTENIGQSFDAWSISSPSMMELPIVVVVDEDDTESGSIVSNKSITMEKRSIVPTKSLSSSDINKNDNHNDDVDEDHDDDKLENKVIAINQNKTRMVRRYKWFAITILLISSFVIATCVYVYVNSSEETRWVNSYESDASKLLDGVTHSILSNLIAMDTFASYTVSFAKNTNQIWPFVTLPNFAIKASKLLSSSDGFTISLQPLIIGLEERIAYEQYSIENQYWVNETLHVQDLDPYFFGEVSYNISNMTTIWNLSGLIPYDDPNRRYMPQWQNYPTYDPSYNWDWFTGYHADAYVKCVDDRRAVFVEPCNLADPNNQVEVEESAFWSDLFANFLPPTDASNEPFSDFMYPIIEGMDDDPYSLLPINEEESRSSSGKVVATIDTTIYWREFIKNQLPESSKGVVVVFENVCKPSFTYQIFGQNVTYLGKEDHHDVKYDQYKKTQNINEAVAEYSAKRYSGVKLDTELCPFYMNVYPSDTYKQQYTSNDPIIFALSVLLIFAFVTFGFLIYDQHVEKRQEFILNTATKSSAIVSSLFPSSVRDQMLERNSNKVSNVVQKNNNYDIESDSALYPTGMSPLELNHQGALANLYPDTTVFFADLAGFTAWSSSRSPTQVFMLLEVLYGAFDAIAKRRKVFKVETIGDCYLAVAGLPNPTQHHAVIIAQFAFDCLTKTSELTGQLTSTLGLGTADLRLRTGINSGPTTAGVLRGEKARFQLFGDTVNTASRMESTGAPGRIQVSQKTADLLIMAGKGDWLHLRADQVEAKGKGLMSTYWLQESPPTSTTCPNSELSSNMNPTNDSEMQGSEKTNLLVNWNVSVFKELVSKVVANRNGQSGSADSWQEVDVTVPQNDPIDEISEFLDTQPLEKIACGNTGKNDIKGNFLASLPQTVEKQLRELIDTIAQSYKSNPFHNFEHACHVVAATTKLLGRIRSFDELKLSSTQVYSQSECVKEEQCLYLDPLTRLAVVFSALVHDIDHRGLSNSQLVQQDEHIALMYHGKSVAEQNSIDVAWKILMQPSFDDLRKYVFVNDAELQRFRKVLVNTVLATDIFDKELKSFRDDRWERVFSSKESNMETDKVLTSTLESTPRKSLWAKTASSVNDLNRKNAIVIEHLIQASDVAHTMQHWKIYQKWNQKLFQEMYKAYVEGSSSKNPATGWYDGEIVFFNHYIIPLAKKLKICGVFGVSCDELFDYAIDNRNEWEKKGRDIVLGWEEQERTYWEKSLKKSMKKNVF